MLIKALIVHIFGANSPRPMRRAIIKLSTAFGASVLTSALLLVQAMEVSLALQLPKDWLSMLLFATTCLALICLLLLSGQSFSTTKFQQLSKLLPLSKAEKMIVYLVPHFILTFFTLLIILPALFVITVDLGLTPVLGIFVLVAAVMSAYGIVHGVSDWPNRLRWPWCIILIAVQLTCVRLFPAASEFNQFILQTLFWTSASLGIVQCVHLPQKIGSFFMTPESLPKTLRLPKSWVTWLLTQFVRNKGTILSYASGVAVTLAVSLLAAKEQLDPSMLYTVLALVVGAAVADMRGLQKVKCCFGIIALRGTAHFFAQQIIAGALITALVSLPLVTYLVFHGMALALEGITYSLLGLGIGIVAGTIVVPQNKDISSQLYASLLITACTFLMQRFLGGSAAIGNIIISSLLLALSAAIEQHRNNFIWRKV